MRTGNDKAIDHLFSRQALLMYTMEEADALVEQFCDLLRDIESQIVPSDDRSSASMVWRYAQTFPEILSRLCSKCSRKILKQVFDIVHLLYSSEKNEAFKGSGHLLKRLLLSLSPIEVYNLLPQLLNVEYPHKRHRANESEFPIPFFIVVTKNILDDKHVNVNLTLEISSVEKLFTLNSSEDFLKRQWGRFTLISLSNLKLLTPDQQKRFEICLWEHVDSDGFPIDTLHYKNAFLELPHPENISPSELIKNYIQNLSFPIKDKPNNRGLSFGGVPEICNELVGSNRNISWSQAELKDILQQITLWWDSSKEALSMGGIPFLPSDTEFTGLKDVLIDVVLDNLTSASKVDVKNINRLIFELEEQGFYINKAIAKGRNILGISNKVLLEKFEASLKSSNQQNIVDVLYAIACVLAGYESQSSNFNKQLLDLVTQKVRWGSEPGLASALQFAQFRLLDQTQYINDKFVHSCLVALKELSTKTTLTRESSEEDFSTNINNRKEAARLAFCLNEYYTDKHVNIPQVLNVWKEICDSPDEFAEIKIQWERSASH